MRGGDRVKRKTGGRGTPRATRRAGRRGGRAVLLAGALLAPLSVALCAGPSLAQAACTNEAVRTEQQSTFLPECRAYELVTTAGRTGVSNNGEPLQGTRAAANGNALAYQSTYTVPGAGDSRQFLARRESAAGTWAVEATAPDEEREGADKFVCESELEYSPNLTHRVLGAGWDIALEASRFGDEPPCAQPEAEIVAGEPRGHGNLYLRTAGGYTLVNAPGAATPGNAQFLGASASFSTIVFSENAQLTSGAPAEWQNLYVWRAGSVHLVTVLPEGKPVGGELAGLGATNRGLSDPEFQVRSSYTNAVSEDGERILFEANGNLYLRINATMEPLPAGLPCEPGLTRQACTVQVDLSHGLGSAGGGTLQFANVAGTRVFFTDERQLTRESTAAPRMPDLYEYDVEDGALRDLTAAPGGHADVLGFSGGAEDGAYVYFVARGQLTGSQENGFGKAAQSGAANLYADHEGRLAFIATLEEDMDATDWGVTNEVLGRPNDKRGNIGNLTARTSPDGRFLAFNSRLELNGRSNAAAQPGECTYGGSEAPCDNIFLYDAEAGSLACASCSPEGRQPTGETALRGPLESSRRGETPSYLSRNVTDRGQVFFSTANRLSPQDENGVSDVYEYRGASARLISPGTAAAAAVFVEASAGGEDVFFSTPQSLVGADTGGGESIYDARAGGGFPGSGTGKPSAAPCASLEGCRPPVSEPPAEALDGSSAFGGPGNIVVPATASKPGAAGRHAHRGGGETARLRARRRLARAR
ncbi:MAG: hypothetical protein ACYCYN_14110, partial [Solirubrobacteraceae bacterium]